MEGKGEVDGEGREISALITIRSVLLQKGGLMFLVKNVFSQMTLLSYLMVNVIVVKTCEDLLLQDQKLDTPIIYQEQAGPLLHKIIGTY